MKNMFMKSLILAVVSIGLFCGSAFALGFPFADFQGAIYVDLDGSSPVINNVHTTGYADMEGSYVLDPNIDSFIGQSVSGSLLSGITYDFTTDTLTISPTATANFYIGSADGTDPYFTATASNFSVYKIGSGNYAVSASLSNQLYFHTADSLFMQEYEAASPSTGIQGELITWDLLFTMPTNSEYDYGINISGKMAPVPEPATMLLFGTGLASLAGVVRRKKK